MLALAGGCVVIGLVPVALWPAVARVAGAWNPAWAGVAVPPAPLAGLGAVHVGLAALFVAAAAWLWGRAQHNGLRRALTWDCGYAAPTARMQYTGGSFAAIASGWFFWILRPERSLRRPRGPFPTEARRVEKLPDAVLAQVIEPVSGVVMQISTAVRRLQQGRLQFYILYVVGGLVALGVLVALGGKS
jgi:hydrogenase-4 component B